jgi:AcrR family transcriptional regulator
VRRRLIIEAAREVIARRGMAATRMRQVAAAAGVSLGTVSYHFSGIDELLAGVIEAEESDFFQPLVERALAADSGREALRGLVDGLLNEDQRTREHWLLWLDFWTLASHDPRFGRWHHRSYGKWREVIAEIVDRGQVDGSLCVADQALAVSQFLALMDGVAAQAYLTGRESPRDAEAPSSHMWALMAGLISFRDTDPQLVAAGPSPTNAVSGGQNVP